MTYHKHHNTKGFTLLEVLLALSIFTVAASSLIIADGNTIKQVAKMQDRILACWLADKTLNDIYTHPKKITTGENIYKKHYANRDWYIKSETLNTSTPRLYRINLGIYIDEAAANNNPKEVICTLVGFKRRPNR